MAEADPFACLWHTGTALELEPVRLPKAGVMHQTPLSRPQCAPPLKLGSLSRFSVDQ